MKILCKIVHDELTKQGFVHTHHDVDVWDDGDGETGPMSHGTPAYDEYESSTERVIADATGILHREFRDLDLEKWLDRLEESCFGE